MKRGQIRGISQSMSEVEMLVQNNYMIDFASKIFACLFPHSIHQAAELFNFRCSY